MTKVSARKLKYSQLELLLKTLNPSSRLFYFYSGLVTLTSLVHLQEDVASKPEKFLVLVTTAHLYSVLGGCVTLQEGHFCMREGMLMSQ